MTAASEGSNGESGGTPRPWWATYIASWCWLLLSALVVAYPSLIMLIIVAVSRQDLFGPAAPRPSIVAILVLVGGFALPFVSFYGARAAKAGWLITGVSASVLYLFGVVAIFAN